MNNITQDMKYKQSLMCYAQKYGVARAARKYNPLPFPHLPLGYESRRVQTKRWFSGLSKSKIMSASPMCMYSFLWGSKRNFYGGQTVIIAVFGGIHEHSKGPQTQCLRAFLAGADVGTGPHPYQESALCLSIHPQKSPISWAFLDVQIMIFVF